MPTQLTQLWYCPTCDSNVPLEYVIFVMNGTDKEMICKICGSVCQKVPV